MSGMFLVLRRIHQADDAEAYVAVTLRSSIAFKTNERNIISIHAHIDAAPCPPQHVIYMFYSYHSVNDVAFSGQAKYVGEKLSGGGDSRLIAMNDRQCSPAASMRNARRVWSKMQNFVIRSPKKFCCVGGRAGIIATIVRIHDTRSDRGRASQWIGNNCMTKFCQLYILFLTIFVGIGYFIFRPSSSRQPPLRLFIRTITVMMAIGKFGRMSCRLRWCLCYPLTSV